MGDCQTLTASDLPVLNVTVYSDRAEVKRLVKLKVEKAGPNEVVVKNLPESIDPDSVRVECRGDVVISEVQYQTKHLTKDEDVREKQNKLKEEIERLRDSLQTTGEEEARVERQKNVLDGLAEQISRGPTKEKEGCMLKVETLEQLDGFLVHFEDRKGKLDERSRQLAKVTRDLEKEIRAAERNLREVGGGHADTFISREVSVLFETGKSLDVELLVSYVVWKASWSPSYDVRVFSEDKKMKIQYYGMIKQSCGEDWPDTQLRLSTATPSIKGQVPKLGTLRVGLQPEHPPAPSPRPMYATRATPMMMKAERHMMVAEDTVCEMAEFQEEEFAPLMLDTVVKEGVTSASFEIPRRSSIPSDNAVHKVNIAVVDLDLTLEHVSVPKKAPHCFLKAKAVNQSQYPLLAGPASIFLDNNFVAKSELSAVSPQMELSCSLGADPAVQVDYKPMHELQQETGLLSRSVHILHTQKLELKNGKRDAVKVRLLEQIPISSDDKIKVSLVEPPAGKQNKAPYRINAENNLEWDVDLKAGESKLLEIKYEIEYPKGRNVTYSEA